MKYMNEFQEKRICDETEAKQLFSIISANDIWQKCYTKELNVMPVDNAPILMDTVRTTVKISPTVTDESMVQCMEGNNLGLQLPFSNGFVGYPVGDTAYNTLIHRAGYQNSPVLTLLTEKTSQKPMSPLDKSNVLNLGLKYFQNKVLVLIRDEKVRAVLSGDEADYSVLPYDELLDTFSDGLRNQFKNVKFMESSLSHEYFITTYQISDMSLTKGITRILSGLSDERVSASVKLISSDVGISGANIYPYIRDGYKERMIGLPLTLTHKNYHGISDFADNVYKIMSMFQDAAEKLEHMDQKKIKYPAGCLLRIAKQIGLPKKLACETAPIFETSYGNNTYQIDVYWALYDILDQYDSYSQGGLSSARRLSLEEGICRIAFSNMSDYDIPFQWE